MQTPYSPPQARVADARPPESEVRPRVATIALVLFGLFVLARCYKLRLTIEQYNTGELSGVMFLLSVLVVGFFIAVGILVAKRVTWARWVLAAVAAWQVYDLRWGIEALRENMYGVPYGPTAIIVWLIPAACTVAATILVFGPANRWFGRSAP